MGRIDHQLLGPSAFCRKLGEDPVEHSQPAPAHEAVVDRLVWAIVLGRIAPPKPVPDHEDDPADHPPVIDPGNPMRQRKKRLNPAHLRVRQPEQITHGSASLHRQ